MSHMNGISNGAPPAAALCQYPEMENEGASLPSAYRYLSGSAEPPAPESRVYLAALWRRKFLILAVAIIVPVAVYVLVARERPVYNATATIQVTGPPVDSSTLVPGVAFSQAPAQIISGAEKLMESTDVASAAATSLREPTQARLLQKAITVGGDPNSAYITVTAASHSPAQAQRIANAFSDAFRAVRSARDIGQIHQAIARTRASVLPGARPSLGTLDELQRLQALRTTVAADSQVLQPASRPSSPVSPRPLRDAMLALGTALLVVIGLIMLHDRFGLFVRDPVELETLAGGPLIGTVPGSAFSADDDDPRTLGLYRSLAINLQYLPRETALQSLVITSALQGDGKTTVALGLAHAVASAGKNVILVDCDLRRSARDAHQEGPSLGLADVLLGEADLDQVIRPVESNGVRFRVIPRGSLSDDPTALMSSQRMREVLSALKEQADMVILDTPAALAVVDAVPVFRQVSGALIIARINATPRPALRRLVRIVENAGGRIVGGVATGAPDSGIYGYDSYYTRRRRRRSVSVSARPHRDEG